MKCTYLAPDLWMYWKFEIFVIGILKSPYSDIILFLFCNGYGCGYCLCFEVPPSRFDINGGTSTKLLGYETYAVRIRLIFRCISGINSKIGHMCQWKHYSISTTRKQRGKFENEYWIFIV